MTPFEPDCTKTAPDVQIDENDQELYLDGLSDGAMGAKPQRNEEPYILGYAEGIRRTRAQGTGQIRWSSPYRKFAFGFVDGIGRCTDGESNYEF